MRKRIFEKILVEKYSIFLLMVLLVSMMCTQTVLAQDAGTRDDDGNNASPEGGIQISPTKFVWTLTGGETKTERVIVKSYADKELTVKMEVEDFFVKNDGSTPQLYVPDANHPRKTYDVISWITPPESFTIEPGGVKSVEFTVRVPEDQPTNGYYGTLLFRTGGGSEESGSQIGLSYRIGALIIMAVQGDEPMVFKGDLIDFYPEKKFFWDTPAVLYTKVDNTGNIHYPMFGDIEVKRWGKTFHKIEMRPRLLYPNTDPVQWREIMPTGIWDFGYYTAHLSMHSEDGSIQLAKSTSFFVIPWKGLAIIAGVLVGLVILKKLFGAFFHVERKKKRK
jgi:hypothetical protein